MTTRILVPSVLATPPSTPRASSRRIIGIAGATGAGKSEFAKTLLALGWRRIAHGDAIKEEVARFCRKTLVAHMLSRMPAFAG